MTRAVQSRSDGLGRYLPAPGVILRGSDVPVPSTFPLLKVVGEGV